MPLEKGPVGSAAFGRNVATEVKAGKPQKQAVAIAYSEAGEKKDCAMSDRLDSILDSCAKMEARVDALCAGRQDSVYDLGAAREAGKSAMREGKPIGANPFPYRMSEHDPEQVRKHEAWESGWKYAREAASGWKPHAGQM